MTLGWDPAKNRANIAAHEIHFRDALRIFEGPTWESIDDRQDYGEERWLAVGLMRGIEITVVYTDRRADGDVVRWIISARRATRDECTTCHSGGHH